MHRTRSGAHLSIAASCLRRLCVACDALQQVRCSPSNCATAHEGPIDPCVWMAKSYVAVSVFAAPFNACAESPLLLVTSSFATFEWRTKSQISRSSGRPCQSDQLTLRLRAALIADHSSFATTPTKLPNVTILTTPGMSAMDDSSTEISWEPIPGGRTARPCNIPGNRKSCMY